MADPLSTTFPRTEPAGLTEPGSKSKVPGYERIMLLIVAVTVAGTCLLISSAEGSEEGHIPWRHGSVLWPLAEALSLFYQYPTLRGAEIKWLIQGLGAAAAVVAALVIWFLRRRDEEERGRLGPVCSVRNTIAGMSLTTAAQIAFLAFGVWSALSCLWAPWPDAALGEGIRNMMLILWAVAIGRSLSPAAARRGAELLLVILAVTAAIGVWYYFERNPAQRLKFPIGNPIFLAACLLPGFSIALAMLAGSVGGSGSAARSPRERLIMAGGGVLALIPLAIAFFLTDSRGPAIGLVIGMAGAAFLILSRRWRIVYTAALAGAIAIIAVLRLWPVSWLLSRPDTVRLRQYAWQYALDLFLSRPTIGRGQAGYVLQSQVLSRKDAVADPSAFPGELLGHAHNEWLEILADLGAVGFAIWLTVIGITVWAAIAALRRYRGSARRPESVEGWYLLGVLAAFLAILVEEATDVALRMPGLPIVFATVLGLLWALSSPSSPSQPPGAKVDSEETDRPLSARGRLRRLGEAAVLLGGFAVAWLVGSVATRDWMAALAEYQIEKKADKRQWDDAIESAVVASGGRLGIEPRLTAAALGRIGVEARLSAAYQAVRVAHDATTDRVQQFLEMLHGADSRNRERIRQLAQEDAEKFAFFFNVCAGLGNGVLSVMPGYPYVAGMIGEVWVVRRDFEAGIAAIGGPALVDEGLSYLEQARQYFALEYGLDPLNAVNGIKLLQLSGDQPLGVRIDLLRLPLRRGPMLPAVERMLEALMQDPAFVQVMDEKIAQAEAALSAGNSPWPDAYAPETLRLAAVVSRLRGDYAQAATFADEAAMLAAEISDRWPAAVGFARKEQGYLLLLAYPEDAARAAEVVRLGLAHWPPKLYPAERENAIRDMSLYYLAAGDDNAAREVIQTLVAAPMTPEALERNIGYGLAELCRIFLAFPPENRPKPFATWMSRALELAPQAITAHWNTVRMALEQKDDAAAMRHLQELYALSDHPQQMAGTLQSLMEAFPDRTVLREFIASVTSQPVDEPDPPASQPSPHTQPHDGSVP